MPILPIAPAPRRGGTSGRVVFVVVSMVTAAIVGFAVNRLHLPSRTLAVAPTTVPAAPPPAPLGVPMYLPSGNCILPLDYAQAFPPGCNVPTKGPSFGITFDPLVEGVPPSDRFFTQVVALPSFITGDALASPSPCSLQIESDATTAQNCAFGPGSYRLYFPDAHALFVTPTGELASITFSCSADPTVVNVVSANPTAVQIVCKPS